MAKKFSVPVILGTAREGRQSEKVAHAIMDVFEEREDIVAQLIDARVYSHGRTIPSWEENDTIHPWRQVMAEADAFLIVTPEYNHGYPGELKMLLDQGFDAYAGKPVVVCGVSSGQLGGARVVENLLPVLRELGMITSQYSLYVSNVGEFEADKAFRKRVNKAGDILVS